jgi:hypothetical protein
LLSLILSAFSLWHSGSYIHRSRHQYVGEGPGKAHCMWKEYFHMCICENIFFLYFIQKRFKAVDNNKAQINSCLSSSHQNKGWQKHRHTRSGNVVFCVKNDWFIYPSIYEISIFQSNILSGGNSLCFPSPTTSRRSGIQTQALWL